MRELGVLVVDDSAVNRAAVADLLRELPGVRIAGMASDGEAALRMAATCAPDLITLDLEMPRMDGFAFLRLLMTSRPTPVVVVSSHSSRDKVFRALELGAIDFVAKPEGLLGGDLNPLRMQLAAMVEMVRRLRATPSPRSGRLESAAATVSAAARAERASEPRHLIVIGASTGGPTALLEIFSQLPPEAQASIVVAQHMPERFTRAFAERLDRTGTFAVAEAGPSEPLRAGRALLCPGGRCIEIERGPSGLFARTCLPTPSDRHAPSVDRLFESAARAMGASCTAVVLTGMGDDGARGVSAVKAAGGRVLAEAEQTAVIYGMPGAAEAAGAVDELLPLPELARRVSGIAAKATAVGVPSVTQGDE